MRKKFKRRQDKTQGRKKHEKVRQLRKKIQKKVRKDGGWEIHEKVRS